MFYYVLKFTISALLIVAISEISKRYSLTAGILASLPIVSVLAMIWLYIDTSSIEKVAQLSFSIFWMVLPSLSLFIVLPVLLKNKVPFYPALTISALVMVLLYYLMIVILKRLGMIA
ncbi:MAG: DUF3147 family protein [Candidatus Zixiibacteriota bacterium]|nr:MAG: DUF3147 family protein [candidate division Zixibacteria bacterium]